MGTDARPNDPLSLDAPGFRFEPVPDGRPTAYEPPPVLLLAVADVSLLGPAGCERELDDLLVDVLGFWKDSSEDAGDATPTLVYRAENQRLLVRIVEAPVPRDGMPAWGVVKRSLDPVAAQLIEREIEFTWEKGVEPGKRSLLLRDPTGNWLRVHESRSFR